MYGQSYNNRKSRINLLTDQIAPKDRYSQQIEEPLQQIDRIIPTNQNYPKIPTNLLCFLKVSDSSSVFICFFFSTENKLHLFSQMPFWMMLYLLYYIIKKPAFIPNQILTLDNVEPSNRFANLHPPDTNELNWIFPGEK